MTLCRGSWPLLTGALTLSALFVGACTPGGDSSSPAFASAPAVVRSDALAENNKSLDWNDPCIMNLDAIVTGLADYISIHNHLPDTLEQIPPGADGTKIPLICPASGKPYQYFPQGFELRREFLPSNLADNPNFRPPMLVLFDPQPSHEITRQISDGKNIYDLKSKVRFGIVMDPPVPNHAVKMWIVPLDQALLDFYLKSPIRPRVRATQ